MHDMSSEALCTPPSYSIPGHLLSPWKLFCIWSGAAGAVRVASALNSADLLPDICGQLCPCRPPPGEHPGPGRRRSFQESRGTAAADGCLRHAGGGHDPRPLPAAPGATGCWHRGGAAGRGPEQLPGRFHGCGDGAGEPQRACGSWGRSFIAGRLCPCQSCKCLCLPQVLLLDVGGTEREGQAWEGEGERK